MPVACALAPYSCERRARSLSIRESISIAGPSPRAKAPARSSLSNDTIAPASVVDFLMSGVLVRFPNLQIAYSEGQIGWIPAVLERADKVWESNRAWGGVAETIPLPPSTYFHRQMYGCFFDDDHGLTPDSLAAIGTDRLLFETDYPHSDSTWPHCREVAEKQMAHLDDETVHALVRGNAIRLLGLDLD